MKKIKVMQLTWGMGIGGLERVIMNLCHYLDKEKYDVSVYCLHKKGIFGEVLESEGYNIYFLKGQNRLNKYIQCLQLASFLKKKKIDILHSHNTTALLDGVLARHLAKIPVHIHTDHIKPHGIKHRHLLAEKFASYFVDRIVAVSKYTREELVLKQGINPKKIEVIYNGVNILSASNHQTLRKIQKELGIFDVQYVVGIIGRLEKQKGYELLLDAAVYILKEFPRKIKFIFVGEGLEEEKLKHKAINLGIYKHIIFTGERVDALSILPLFDVFVMTSYKEGMPMVLLEAMAMRKPIVSTAVGGIPEIVKDGENGFLIYSRNPETLAKKILTLLKNQDLRISMGNAGFKLYNQYFTVDIMVKKYQYLYEKYLNKAKRSFK